MKVNLLLAGALLASATIHVPARAADIIPTPLHAFELNGTLKDSKGDATASLVRGAQLGGAGVTFRPDQGITLNGALASAAVYSLEFAFRFDQLNDTFSRLFSSGGVDRGLYVYRAAPNDAFLTWYEGSLLGNAKFTTGDMHHIVFTRDALGMSAYLDGKSAFNLTGNYASSVIDGPLNMFLDNGNEESGGFADFVRTYDTRLSELQASQLYASYLSGPGAVPEPAAWALMILGFGAVGTALRRQRRLKPALAYN